MNTAFLDTVGLLALWNRSDQWHTPAEEAFDELRASNSPHLDTTNRDMLL